MKVKFSKIGLVLVGLYILGLSYLIFSRPLEQCEWNPSIPTDVTIGAKVCSKSYEQFTTPLAWILLPILGTDFTDSIRLEPYFLVFSSLIYVVILYKLGSLITIYLKRTKN